MSNPDYDPIKAHEYYEKHKKLKGRRSTKGMTQEQKEQLAYAKAQIQEGYKSDIKTISDASKQYLEAIEQDKQEKKKAITAQTKAQVESIRRRLKSMSPEGKAQMREQLQGLIDSIRERAGQEKMKVQSDAAKSKSDVKDATKALKEEAKSNKESSIDAVYKKLRGE